MILRHQAVERHHLESRLFGSRFLQHVTVNTPPGCGHGFVSNLKKGAAGPLLLIADKVLLLTEIYPPDEAPFAPPIFWTISVSF